MADENVKVAVRVRPFNQREKEAKSELIINMVGNQTIIRKPRNNEEQKKFAYDYSYWSHDGFKIEANGYSSPENSEYCDQRKVFNDLGMGVLNNAWNGFNASLFAYGQTGSGKSYSVIGYGSNRGIVPLVCEEIFRRIKGDSSGNQFEVTYSMLEIYSEVCRDLISAQRSDKKSGLPIREDPKIGFYPQGLKKQLVSSYDDISKLMDEGTSNRTIAATNMNATSSRAHTIITITFVQKYKNEAGKEMAKSSVINLVDLAGSERADATGATGDRLKEGAAINLSLTSLGNVIAALAENSNGKNVRVPYRDSVLTKLLMNALGGNSKTIMIAAISPADINFDESLSTLRYADRAKQIKTKAVVNEDPTEKLIRSLQEENTRLKELLAKGVLVDQSVIQQNSNVDDNEQIKKALEENERIMLEMKLSYEEKIAQARLQSSELQTSKISEKAKAIPHLSNINMDPSLSHSIKYIIEGEGKKLIGNDSKCDIRLNGLGILGVHCSITNKNHKFILEKNSDGKILKNGKQVYEPIEINHLDRLAFGASQYFLFIDPSKRSSSDILFTFEQAQDEIAKENGMRITQDMSKEEIQCQQELIDILPRVEEANYLSIILDKKVKYEALAVSAEARGEYDGQIRPFIYVRNFSTGMESLWTREKFLDRQILMSEYYADFKDDGIINGEKFKNFDPFVDSSDVPIQLGSIMIVLRSFAYMVPIKDEFKIIDYFGRQVGHASIDILPCNDSGNIIDDNQIMAVQNPQKELLNKKVSFIIRIKSILGISQKFEKLFCQFTIFDNPEINKTETIKSTKEFDFNYNKIFNFEVNKQNLDNLLNKCFFIQVWGFQKQIKIDIKLSTKELFLKNKNKHVTFVDKDNDARNDLNYDELLIEYNSLRIKEKKNSFGLDNIKKIVQKAKVVKKVNIPVIVIEELLEAQSESSASKIIDRYIKKKGKLDT